MSAAYDDDRVRIRLLIIDDEDDLRALLKDTADSYGFEVSDAASVDDALRQLAAGLTVDVVLCDVTMPDGGADKWLRLSRTACPQLEARTIITTGWVPSGAGQAVPDGPTDRYLYKPFVMGDLRALAARLMKQSD